MQATYPGDQRASEILKKADSYLSLGELKARLAGVLMGHSFVSPSVVLDDIEFGAIDQPEVADRKMATDFMLVFFGLWNDIAKCREPNCPFAFSPPDPTWKNENVREWLDFADLREKEMGEFLIGLGMSETPTADDLKEIGVDVKNYLPKLLASSLDRLGMEARKIRRQKVKALAPLIEIVRQVDNDMKVHHAALLQKMAEIEVASDESADEPI